MCRSRQLLRSQWPDTTKTDQVVAKARMVTVPGGAAQIVLVMQSAAPAYHVIVVLGGEHHRILGPCRITDYVVVQAPFGEVAGHIHAAEPGDIAWKLIRAGRPALQRLPPPPRPQPAISWLTCSSPP